MGSNNVRRRKSRRKAISNSTKRSKKLKKKTSHVVKDPINLIVRKNWKSNLTVKQNIDEMGIAFDSNAVIPLKESSVDKFCDSSKPSIFVKEVLECTSISQKCKKNKLSGSEARIIALLVEKYGNNYKKMTHDKRNILQLTESQLKWKCTLYDKQ